MVTVYKTRRGLVLRGPSPPGSSVKVEVRPAVIRRPVPPKKPKPVIDHARKLRYQQARTKIGMSPNSTGSIVWGRAKLSPKTSFIWKFDTLAETAQWVITETFKAMQHHSGADRAAVAIHYTCKGFGIAKADLMAPNRHVPIVIARFVAMVCVRRAGVGRNDTARRFKRDYTVIKLAEKRVGKFFEGINYDDFKAQHLGAGGPAPDSELERNLSS